ncbi:hypothetical protein AB0K00_42650 [Dactylosporangium sp. NPDC049525]|uniref:hypothetical protein n=1 Tax=Dactylosporangium sp. NPDC049525 TaxID=3154730 RepID=UPI00342F77DC
MSEEEWVEVDWDGTLASGLAQRANLDQSYLARFDVLDGRADLERAIGKLVNDLGGEVEYAESTDSASDAHLTFSRVHLRLRGETLGLVEQATALVIGLALLNPGAVTPAIQLVRKLIDLTTILAPAEQSALTLIMANRRNGIPTTRADIASLGVDVDSLITKGVLVEREGTLWINA